MDLQATLGREAFLAEGALVRLLTCIPLPPQMPDLVTSKVLGKVPRLPKGLVATLDGAEVGTFASVDAFVLRQIRRLVAVLEQRRKGARVKFGFACASNCHNVFSPQSHGLGPGRVSSS